MPMPPTLELALASFRRRLQRGLNRVPSHVVGAGTTAAVAAMTLLGASQLQLFTVRVDKAAPLPAPESPWLVQKASAVDDAACQLSLRVLDDDGAPRADAVLSVVRLQDGQVVDRQRVGTDSRGAHRFIDLPTGAYDVTVEVDGKALAGAPTFSCDRPGKRGYHDVAVADATQVLTGRVVGLKGRPLPLAEVALWQTDRERTGLAGVVRVRTDEDGRFTAPLLPGRYVAYVSAGDHVARKFDVDVREATTAFTARLQYSPSVKGVVVDEAGQPLVGAVVSMGGAFDPRARAATVKTDAFGRFAMPVQLGQHVHLTARGDGRVARMVLGVVEEVQGLQQLRLVASSGRTVQGLVMRTDGEPLAFGAVHYRVKALGLEGETQTDGGGHFVLDGMPLDQDVEVWAAGNATGAWGAQVATPQVGQLALTFVPPAW